jgi:hypothetical protein
MHFSDRTPRHAIWHFLGFFLRSLSCRRLYTFTDWRPIVIHIQGRVRPSNDYPHIEGIANDLARAVAVKGSARALVANTFGAKLNFLPIRQPETMSIQMVGNIVKTQSLAVQGSRRKSTASAPFSAL